MGFIFWHSNYANEIIKTTTLPYKIRSRTPAGNEPTILCSKGEGNDRCATAPGLISYCHGFMILFLSPQKYEPRNSIIGYRYKYLMFQNCRPQKLKANAFQRVNVLASTKDIHVHDGSTVLCYTLIVCT
jgi:hypothetical protein